MHGNIRRCTGQSECSAVMWTVERIIHRQGEQAQSHPSEELFALTGK